MMEGIMAKTIKMWCIPCGKLGKFTLAPTREDHNICTVCTNHATTCKGCGRS